MDRLGHIDYPIVLLDEDLHAHPDGVLKLKKGRQVRKEILEVNPDARTITISGDYKTRVWIKDNLYQTLDGLLMSG